MCYYFSHFWWVKTCRPSQLDGIPIWELMPGFRECFKFRPPPSRRRRHASRIAESLMPGANPTLARGVRPEIPEIYRMVQAVGHPATCQMTQNSHVNVLRIHRRGKREQRPLPRIRATGNPSACVRQGACNINFYFSLQLCGRTCVGGK
jgi:hypothetical protein